MSILGVPCILGPEQLGAFMSQYGDVKSVIPVCGPRNLMVGDYNLKMRVDKEGLQNIPPMLRCDIWSMSIIVEGRRAIWHGNVRKETHRQ